MDISEIIVNQGQEQDVDRGQRYLVPDTHIWYVAQGKVDIFLAKFAADELKGSLHHVWRVEAGQIFFGVDVSKTHAQWRLLARNNPDTKVYKLSLEECTKLLTEPAQQKVMQTLLEQWIGDLYHHTLDGNHQGEFVPIEDGCEAGFSEGQIIGTKKKIVWVQHLQGASYLFAEEDYILDKPALVFPLIHGVWLAAEENLSVAVFNTQEILTRDDLWESLKWFHQVIYQRLIVNLTDNEAQETELLANKVVNNKRFLADATNYLQNIFARRKGFVAEKADMDALMAACKLIGRYADIKFRAPRPQPATQIPRTTEENIDEISQVSKIRNRRIMLGANWWQQDLGPVLAFYGPDAIPIALLPKTATSYQFVHPETHQLVDVDESYVSKIGVTGFTFYRAFENKKLKVFDILKFGFRGNANDFLIIMLVGVIAGLISLVVPIATGTLYDDVIPSGSRSQLFQITLLIVSSAFSMMAFNLVRGFAALRIESRMNFSIESGLWDRLLKLPAAFFRNYTAGDLSMRANGMTEIRRILSENLLDSLLNSIFAIFNFFILFYYSITLAFVAMAIIIFNLLLTVVVSILRIHFERRILKLEGEIAGMVSGFIFGIAKIRTTGSESRVFAKWAKKFAKSKKISIVAAAIENWFGAFNGVCPLLSSIIVFAVFTYFLKGQLTTGRFLAFNAAYLNFLNAILGMTDDLVGALEVIPTYERAVPIFQAAAETDESKPDPGELTGKIELSHVVFQYTEDSPLIVNDMSMTINAGEFVALVGPSGTGKSTLLRLLLQFEKPQSGSIYYDDKDLANLDVDLVRRQIGVVMQNSQLLPGDVFTNIVGSSALTLDDAWEAARRSGLAKDIEAMPMGMHTLVSEGGIGFSGGQKQRILIASAIVHKPKILFFDEATSALDNETQAIVSESLENLNVTRLVVAHRLSTIVNADRIYVLKEGKIIESGNYEELMAQQGMFAELAKRQLT